jgi:hypothetical protein
MIEWLQSRPLNDSRCVTAGSRFAIGKKALFMLLWPGESVKRSYSSNGGIDMTTTPTKDDGTRLIDSIERAEHVSLEAVRRFLDSVDSVFPSSVSNDGPRRKIIDSAFKMTEQLVGAANGLAKNILDTSEKVLRESDRKSVRSTK